MICGKGIDVPEGSLPYMGYYVYELEKTASGIRTFCTLHHYYTAVCDCGHVTKAQPGEGYISRVEGRKKDLKLTEYTMVGHMLATFIAALSVRFRMSSVKISPIGSYESLGGSLKRWLRMARAARENAAPSSPDSKGLATWDLKKNIPNCRLHSK